MTRRDVLASLTAGALSPAGAAEVPAHLRAHADLYRRDPRAASLQWFREAKFGLFIHYGLYSLLGRHEWVQFRERIPVAEYAGLARRDLVAAMARACRQRGLGLFLFYEHGFDWRHPHGPAPWDWKNKSVRSAYDPPDPWYAPREEHDFRKYLDYVKGFPSPTASRPSASRAAPAARPCATA